MSKCKISTKYIIGKFENIYVYFSLFLFLSFAFDLAENLICTPKKKKKKFISSPIFKSQIFELNI